MYIYICLFFYYCDKKKYYDMLIQCSIHIFVVQNSYAAYLFFLTIKHAANTIYLKGDKNLETVDKSQQLHNTHSLKLFYLKLCLMFLK